eukprot:XP_002271873.1 PREDICTED: uncharacterized protein LOC100264332 [Vitis vinifera]
MNASLKEINRSSSRVLQKSNFQGNQFDKVSPEAEQDGFTNEFKSTSPPSRRITANPATTPGSEHGLFKDAAQDLNPNISGKRVLSDGPDRPWSVVPSSNAMEVSWSYQDNGSAVDEMNANGGPRWRSDEMSEGEEKQSPERVIGVGSYTTPARGIRRIRLSRR